jgi:hypothetical protein
MFNETRVLLVVKVEGRSHFRKVRILTEYNLLLSFVSTDVTKEMKLAVAVRNISVQVNKKLTVNDKYF